MRLQCLDAVNEQQREAVLKSDAHDQYCWLFGLPLCTHLLLWDIRHEAVELRLDCNMLCHCQAFEHNGVYHWPLGSTPLYACIAAAAKYCLYGVGHAAETKSGACKASYNDSACCLYVVHPKLFDT